MKKIFSFILSLFLVISLIPISAFADSEAEEYISETVDISSTVGKRAFARKGESVRIYYEYLYYHNNAPWYLIDLNALKNQSDLVWSDRNFSSNENTLTWKGIDYKMYLASAGTNDQKGAVDLSAWNYKTYSVTQGNYDKLSILANGTDMNNTTKGLGVILIYSDGRDYKVSKPVYEGLDSTVKNTDYWNGFSVSSAFVNSGSGYVNSYGTVDENSMLHYINTYDIEVDNKRTLTGFILLGGGVQAIADITNGYIPKVDTTIKDRPHSGANVFAVTAVVSKNRMARDLKARVDSVILSNANKNINTDVNYYNEIKAIYDEAVTKELNLNIVFGDYNIDFSDMQISGTYGEGNALSISGTVSDSFGRPVTLSDIKWYKSDTITTDETAWTQIGTGETYTMQASDVGSYIYVTAVPTCEAVSGIPEIKTTGDRKISDVFFRIVAPEAKYAYFKADRGIESTYAGEEISLNYGYEDLNGDIESGTVFTFEKSSKINGEYTVVQTSTDNKYVVKAEDLNCFVRCKVKVKNTAEKGDEAAEKISENVYFVQDDKTSFGTKLFGEYKENENVIVLRNEALENGVKDVSAYEWYTTDKMINAFPEGWTKSSENTQLFNISSDIFGKYVAVAVTPKTEKSGVVTEGDKIVKYFYSQQSPIAYDVKITSDNTDVKNTKSGDKLTGTYKYADPNGDSENGTKVLFEKSADGETWETLIEDVSTYELVENDTDMYIRFSVIPKSGEEPENTGEKTSSESFVTPFAPEVTNPTISGTASAGNTLTASYTFSDKNGNADVDSEIVWYSLSGAVKTQIGKGVNYVLTFNEAGKSVMYEITPKTTVEPKTGTTVSSNSVAVSSVYISGGSIGSTSSGGSYSGGSSYKGTTTTAPPLDYTQKELEGTFSDISGHWAEKSILSMNEKGYMTGYEKKFRPDDFITKAELSAVICRVLGLNDEFSECFSDVSKEAWYGANVSNLYKNNIVNGDNGYFYPTSNITRQESAKIFCESYKYMKNLRDVSIKDISTFYDSDKISDWAKTYVGAIYNLGLMNGDTNSNFNPTASLTRAEACAIIERFCAFK